MSIETSLRSEIQDELTHLHKMEVGSEQYEKSVNGITKLIDKVIEIEKLNAESAEKEECRQTETKLKLQQMKEEQKDRFIKNCIAVAGITIPSIITVWGTLKSIEFEKEGTITTIMGRGFINKLLPKK